MTQTTSSGLNWSNRNTSNIHEDIKDMVAEISRTDAPVTQVLGATTATNVNHEWFTWTLPAPTIRAYREGADHDGTQADATARVRIGNYLQDMRETIDVSGRAESLNVVGGGRESQKRLNRGMKIQVRNIEHAYVGRDPTGDVDNYIKSATETNTNVTTDGTKMGSIPSFASNIYIGPSAGTRSYKFGSTNVSGVTLTQGHNFLSPNTVNNANGTAQPQTTGAAVQLERSHIEDALTGVYTNGNGNPDYLFVPGALKTRTSAILSIDAAGNDIRRLNAMDRKINIAMLGVTTDFGFELTVAPNYIMDSAGMGDSFLMFDSNTVNRAFAPGRKMSPTKIARDGDSKKMLVIDDECVEVENPVSVVLGIGFQANA